MIVKNWPFPLSFIRFAFFYSLYRNFTFTRIVNGEFKSSLTKD